MHEESGVSRSQKKHEFHILTQMGRKMTTEEQNSITVNQSKDIHLEIGNISVIL